MIVLHLNDEAAQLVAVAIKREVRNRGDSAAFEGSFGNSAAAEAETHRAAVLFHQLQLMERQGLKLEVGL